jgi:predicted  nucleic acid-binding Zn-ribbon protein
MNPTLQQLQRLQEIDNEYIAVQRKLKGGPKELEKAKSALDEAEAAAAATEQEIQREQVAADEAELEVKSAEAEIEKLKGKLNTVKNNKEYTLVRSAMDEVDRKRAQAETNELQHMEQVEALQQRLAQEQEAVAAAREAYEALRAEVEAESEELRPQAEGIKERRKALAAEVDPEVLATYEQVIRRTRGQALVPVRNSACQGCFRQASPNEQNLILLGRDLVRCPACGRYLYQEDGPEGEAPDDEA